MHPDTIAPPRYILVVWYIPERSWVIVKQSDNKQDLEDRGLEICGLTDVVEVG